MPSYAEFESSGTTYSFSKGPKSLYYGKGDEDLLGVVLNVPQTDVDDEWGGTERIALERLTDRISDLIEAVEDPHGASTGLLADVSALKTIVDTTTPKITLGSIGINGSTNVLTVGSCTLKCTLLTFGSDFGVIPDTSQYGINYKFAKIALIDDGVNRYVDIRVGPSLVNYRFGVSAFTVPSTVTTTFLGPVIMDILSLPTFTATTANISTGNITTALVGALTVSGATVLSGTVSIPGTTTAGIVNMTSGTFSTTFSGGAITVASANVTTATITTATITYLSGVTSAIDIIQPNVDITTDLGTGTKRWKTTYSLCGSFLDMVEAGSLKITPNTGDIYTTGMDWFDYSATSTIVGWASYITKQVFFKKIGKTAFLTWKLIGTSNATSTSLTIPAPIQPRTGGPDVNGAYFAQDNGTDQTYPGRFQIGAAGTTVSLSPDWKAVSPTSWTASGQKICIGYTSYVTD